MNSGHRRWECPQQRMYSANVICRLCGGGKFNISRIVLYADYEKPVTWLEIAEVVVILT